MRLFAARDKVEICGTGIVLSSLMILVVDDDPADCEMLRLVLKRAGYSVHCTRTARDALQVLESITPGLLVIDLRMADIDGWELIRLVRQKAVMEKVPILVYTASSSEADRERTLAVGANEYVTKGLIGWDQLVAHVRRLHPRLARN